MTNGTAEEHKRELREVLFKGESRVPCKREDGTIQKRTDAGWLPHKPELRKTDKRQDRSDYKIGSPKELKRDEIILELNSTSI